MSFTIEKINADVAEAFAKKYGVCIDGGMPQTATGLEALCHRVYNKGWADCREKMLNKRWIPCSERLPEENGNYLVTVEANDGTASINFQMVDHYGPDWLHEGKHEKVIAWMPLPEPYQSND